MKQIVSSANPVFRELLSLSRSARERRSEGLSVVEGVHLLETFVSRHGAPRQLFLPQRSQSTIEAQPEGELARIVRAAGLEPVVLADRLFGQVSQVENGPGPLAVVVTPRPVLPQRIAEDAIYLDRVQDPGNVGSILRSCAAVGVSRVIAAPGTAFCWSPKVLRAAMGAHFHLDIHEGVPPDELLARLGVGAIATAAGAERTLYEVDLRPPRVWLLGNEGQGLERALLTAPGLTRVAIPQTPAVESLNVGVAAAVCLYEQLRQRRQGAGR
jgi:TrmH family RNA methyltransferase